MTASRDISIGFNPSTHHQRRCHLLRLVPVSDDGCCRPKLPDNERLRRRRRDDADMMAQPLRRGAGLAQGGGVDFNPSLLSREALVEKTIAKRIALVVPVEAKRR
mmetsp:Transcript_4492/g.9760  ORF Transcript_4492/g.9760 Transcript_4492/m.9760 type:complete len:105 (-) Transcript_4492:17-331(-)